MIRTVFQVTVLLQRIEAQQTGDIFSSIATDDLDDSKLYVGAEVISEMTQREMRSKFIRMSRNIIDVAFNDIWLSRTSPTSLDTNILTRHLNLFPRETSDKIITDCLILSFGPTLKSSRRDDPFGLGETIECMQSKVNLRVRLFPQGCTPSITY